MEKELLIKMIGDGMSQRRIADELSLSQSTVKYWLNKFDLKTTNKKYNRRTNSVNKFCTLCGKEILNNVHNRSKCSGCVTRIRRYRMKKRAVEYLGCYCKKCGWTGNIAAFEFHHIDGDKNFGIGNASNKSWEIIKLELDKCELLCSNCHRIEHAKYDDENFLIEVDNYQGN